MCEGVGGINGYLYDGEGVSDEGGIYDKTGSCVQTPTPLTPCTSPTTGAGMGEGGGGVLRVCVQLHFSHSFRADVIIYWLQPQYSAAGCSQVI